jgi:hypothetical protein
MRNFAMTRTKTLLLLACIFLVGCKDNSEKMEDVIKRDLPYGTSAAEVESYLKKMNCGFSYDKETKRYTSILRDDSQKKYASKRILITIKMDEQDKLKNLDFMVYYKGP